MDNFLYNDALWTKNLANCKRITEEWLKENCLSTLVFQMIESKDFPWNTNICNELQEHNKQYCLQTIENKTSSQDDVKNLEGALQTNDISGCDSIANEPLKKGCKDNINLKLAFSSQDKSKCSLLYDENRKKSCLEHFSKEDDKQFFTQATQTLNKSMCEKILNNETKIQCNDTILFKIAIQNKDKTQCNMILNPSLKTDCEKLLSVE